MITIISSSSSCSISSKMPIWNMPEGAGARPTHLPHDDQAPVRQHSEVDHILAIIDITIVC